jgi:hypothetical protein
MKININKFRATRRSFIEILTFGLILSLLSKYQSKMHVQKTM